MLKVTSFVTSSTLFALLSSPLVSAAPINQGMFKVTGDPQDGANTQQGMSRSGRYIAFTNGAEIYLRDIKTQTSILLSNTVAPEFALSPNGRYAAFVRQQTNPIANVRVVLDRVTNVETIIPSISESNIGLSNNGYVLFVKQVSSDKHLIRLNLNDSSETIVATGNISLGSSNQRNPLSADGNVALFKVGSTYKIYDAATMQTTILAPTRSPGIPVSIESIDLASSGKFVAFSDSHVGGSQVYKLDLANAQQTSTTFDLSSKDVLISANSALSISADGRFISFRGEVLPGNPEWVAAKALDPNTGSTQGYARIFRADTQTNTLVTMSTAHDGGVLLAAPSQSSPVHPIVNLSTIISDDGSMVELSTSSHNIVSTTVSQNMSEANYHVYLPNGYARNYQFVGIPHSDISFKPFAPMTLVGNNQWEGYITFDGVGTESFKFDVGGTLVNGKFTATPNWAINFGAGSTPNQAVANGANIAVTGGAGTYKITFNDLTRAYTITKETSAGDWQRTVVFIEGQTQTGQDMFIRGGIDHGYAQSHLGLTCTEQNLLCAIPIRHLNLRSTTTAPWKANDTVLDWYGKEAGQPSAVQGSPLDWTTNLWPTSWGTKRTVAVDGYGETPLNLWGSHYWMFEVEMDCSKTVNGWFEVKSFISNGPGWESDVSQPGAPYASGNHFAQCGKLNVFRRSQSNPVVIGNF